MMWLVSFLIGDYLVIEVGCGFGGTVGLDGRVLAWSGVAIIGRFGGG